LFGLVFKEVDRVAAKPIVVKVLLQQRHLQTHRAFCREYDRVAADIDRALKGGWPSKAQFYRWLSGELVGLPYPDHCRILEGMFPGWRADQLFQAHDGGIEFIPEPPMPQTQTPAIRPIPPTAPADKNSATTSQALDVLAGSRRVSGVTSTDLGLATDTDKTAHAK
jgi:hypothetical protein